ncbi:hypothetical protein NM688_g5960 [Phlebia brevispora]|uniref:Uncharacterized protein n=1 Tax=Phlebia brevispora TaxID=194682 RepID=A0ACC1SM23_9APHY|nr:hypothetical protein NM688_g5960 [Phlebia brevispora]
MSSWTTHLATVETAIVFTQRTANSLRVERDQAIQQLEIQRQHFQRELHARGEEAEKVHFVIAELNASKKAVEDRLQASLRRCEKLEKEVSTVIPKPDIRSATTPSTAHVATPQQRPSLMDKENLSMSNRFLSKISGLRRQSTIPLSSSTQFNASVNSPRIPDSPSATQGHLMVSCSKSSTVAVGTDDHFELFRPEAGGGCCDGARADAVRFARVVSRVSILDNAHTLKDSAIWSGGYRSAHDLGVGKRFVRAFKIRDFCKSAARHSESRDFAESPLSTANVLVSLRADIRAQGRQRGMNFERERWSIATTSNVISIKLNVYILSRIMTFISRRKDLLAVMHSCRDLYGAGIQPLVRLVGPIDECNLPSFHEFMIKFAPASFKAFRHLDIIVRQGQLSSTLVRMLIDLLERGTALEELKVSYGTYLNRRNALLEAIASLTTLTSLSFCDNVPDEASHFVLSNSRSPLREVRASYFDGDPVEAVSLLANFLYTLEKASLTCVRLEDVGLCYPNLTHLELLLCMRPILSVLMKTFPNLQHLDLGAPTSRRGTDPVRRQEMAALRAANIQFQQHTCASWDSLRFLTTDTASLSMLGLKMKIDSLYVDSPVKDKLDVSWLGDGLSLLLPKALHLTCMDDPSLLSSLFEVTMGSLDRLYLTVLFGRYSEYKTSLDTLVSGLACVDTKVLELYIGFHDDGYRTYNEDAKRFFQKLGNKSIAARIFVAMRNLRILKISTYFYYLEWADIPPAYCGVARLCPASILVPARGRYPTLKEKLVYQAGPHLHASMSDIRVIHFQDPQAFLDAVKQYDDSFMNFALGSLLDSLNSENSLAKDQPATYRTLLAAYKGDRSIITLTKARDDFAWALATPRGVEEELSSQDIADAVERLVVLLSNTIEPKLLDSVIGPFDLVNAFIETWVSHMQTQGLQLRALDPFFNSRVSFATLGTIPPSSSAFSQYRFTLAETEEDANAVAPLAVDFTSDGPRTTTLDKAKRIMHAAVQMKQVWLCHVEGQLAAYSLVGRVTPRTIAIRNVYVSPVHRRKGIAEAMVRALTRYYLGAEPLGFEGAPSPKPAIGTREEICLNVAKEDVARLYERCGFLLGPDDQDPATGRKGSFKSVWRGVEIL